jgi:4-hydroxy-4-methyl-2-oxoglutarate aldolase
VIDQDGDSPAILARGSRNDIPGLIDALRTIHDCAAKFSDLLEREGYRLTVPGSVLRPTTPSGVVIGPAITLRYLPVRRHTGNLTNEDPSGKLGNMRMLAYAQRGSVMVVESPSIEVSVMGSEAAAGLIGAGVVGAIVDGAIRDVAGLAALQFPCWSRGRTPNTGRWRIEATDFGSAVAICGIQVQPGDMVVADDGGVAFVPSDRFVDLASRLVPR